MPGIKLSSEEQNKNDGTDNSLQFCNTTFMRALDTFLNQLRNLVVSDLQRRLQRGP